MMALESRLVYPSPNNLSPAAWDLSQESQHDVSFEAEDGTKLHGWYFEHEQPRFAILYCHGNGEDISSGAAHMSFLRERLHASVFAFDYRGYGKSDGAPHESGLILDGLAAQRWLADKMQIETGEIVIIGRSLGGGVAVAIAEQQGAKALVLQNTFADLSSVAADKFFWLPVRWMMRNRFPSVDRIRVYTGPVLQAHGTNDRVVPYARGEQLFAASPGKAKQWIKHAGLGHNDPMPKKYYDVLAEFLNGLP